MRFRDLALLALLTGCSSYEIPEQEATRLQILVYQNELKEIDFKELFQNQEHPQLMDHFFYVLYNLEQQPGNYLVNKDEMVNYFKKHNFDSSVPLDDLEKIVREHDFLKIYTGGFSKTLPGSSGQLSICASEDLCFYSQENKQKPGHLNLNLALGSLNIEFNFPLNLIYNAKPEVKKLEVYDQGKNIIFYCQCLVNGQLKKTRIIYHAEDGSISPRDHWDDSPTIQAK